MSMKYELFIIFYINLKFDDLKFKCILFLTNIQNKSKYF